MGLYQLYLPAAGTNLLPNPSLEINADGYTAVGGATLARASDHAAFGGWSLKVTPNATFATSGAAAAVSLVVSTAYVLSAHIYGVDGVGYTIYVARQSDGVVIAETAFIGTGAFQRLAVAVTTEAAVTSYMVGVARTTLFSADPFFVDGWQLERVSATATTYIDGDQPGCIWNGKPHASTSTRSEQWRGGGKIVDIEDYGFRVVTAQGVGAAGYTNVSTDNGIIGGATFQRSIVKPRPFALTLLPNSTSTLTALHANRQSLIDALKPNLVSPQQPVVLRYTGAGDPRIIHCHLEPGLDNAANLKDLTSSEVRLIAFDPYWYAEFQEHKLLPAFDNIPDANYVIERGANGTYHAMAGGLNGLVRAELYGDDGNLYVGGDFTIAYNSAGAGSPVTVNRVAMWDGTAWSALGAGFNNIVFALAKAPDGTIYAGGAFTDAATPYIAKWSGSAWSMVGSAAAGTGLVRALAYNAVNGKLYIAGEFTNWNADANADHIVSWDGTNYSALVSGTDAPDGLHCMVLEPTGNVLVGGFFGTIGGVVTGSIARWNITTGAWSSVAFNNNGIVYALAVDRAGLIYAGGAWTTPTDYPYLAVYNGSSWAALGSGVNGTVRALNALDDGRLIVAGSFTTAGGSTLNDRTAMWNGSAWATLLLDLPGSAIVFAGAHNTYTNELTLGYDTAGTAIAANTVDTEVVNSGTEDTAPLIFINHAGTIEAIINWTTGAAIYFNLQAQPGEWFYLDLSVLTPQHAPTWHASPFGRNGPRLWSTARGDCTRFILPQSNLTSWRLLPGANTILVKSRGAAAGSAFLLTWKRRYVSNDA